MDVLLPGQTDPTLNLGTVTPEDNGRKFKLVVSNGVLPNLTKTVTINVQTPPPVITGDPYQGQTLTSTIAGQWHINDAAVPGETGDTFVVPGTVLLGDEIRCGNSIALEVVRIPDSCGIRIDTTKPGSDPDTFIIRANTGAYDCRIYWGDGAYSDVTAFDDPNLKHQYADPGKYDVQISGQFARFYWNNLGDKDKLIAVDQLGRTGWSPTQAQTFHSCTNLSRFICDGDEWNHVTSLVTTFSSLNSLTSFPNMNFPGVGILNGTWWPGPTGNEIGVINAPNCTDFTNTWRQRGTFTSFAPRTFQSMSSGLNTFNGSTVPTQDYSEILVHIESDNPNNNVTFHGGNSKYNPAAAVARAELVNRGWTITDGGPE